MIHYKQWWNLDANLSLHYGIWDKGTKSFAESLVNTNKILMNLADVKSSDLVLDAGCGVGGAAFFLAKEKGARIEGITLSEKQVAYARAHALKKGLQEKVNFHIMDYTQTSFEEGLFDVVWACESVSSAIDKKSFIAEAFRLLKKGGRLVIADYFVTDDTRQDKKQLLKKWGATWGIADFPSKEEFCSEIANLGFSKTHIHDYTDQIEKSARRMYHAAILGAIPSELYNLTHPNVSKFAKAHYKSGYYQFKALKARLWKYLIFQVVK